MRHPIIPKLGWVGCLGVEVWVDEWRMNGRVCVWGVCVEVWGEEAEGRSG